MTFIVRKTQLNVERWAETFPDALNKRSDARMKDIQSVSDLRAWKCEESQRAQYLLESMHDELKPMKRSPRLIPADVLLKLTNGSDEENIREKTVTQNSDPNLLLESDNPLRTYIHGNENDVSSESPPVQYGYKDDATNSCAKKFDTMYQILPTEEILISDDRGYLGKESPNLYTPISIKRNTTGNEILSNKIPDPTDLVNMDSSTHADVECCNLLKQAIIQLEDVKKIALDPSTVGSENQVDVFDIRGKVQTIRHLSKKLTELEKFHVELVMALNPLASYLGGSNDNLWQNVTGIIRDKERLLKKLVQELDNLCNNRERKIGIEKNIGEEKEDVKVEKLKERLTNLQNVGEYVQAIQNQSMSTGDSLRNVKSQVEKLKLDYEKVICEKNELEEEIGRLKQTQDRHRPSRDLNTQTLKSKKSQSKNSDNEATPLSDHLRFCETTMKKQQIYMQELEDIVLKQGDEIERMMCNVRTYENGMYEGVRIHRRPHSARHKKCAYCNCYYEMV